MKKYEDMTKEELIKILKEDSSYDKNTHYKLKTQKSKIQESQRELKESEDRFRAIFEQAGVGVALLNTKTGQFIRINQKYCDFVGYTMEEMLQKSFMDITYHEDIQKNIDKNFQFIEGNNKEFSFEKRYVHKNGKIIWGNLTISPLWKSGEKPETYYHIAIVENITERKQADDSLRESEEKLRAMFNIANIGISITDKNGKYVTFNNWWTDSLGYNREEMKNLTNLDITHPDDRENSRTWFLKIIEGMVDKYRIEKRFIRKDNSIFWGDLSVSAIKDKENNVTNVIGMVTDITERKQIENIMTFLAQCGSTVPGEEFFQTLARYLALNLEMNFVCIDRLEGDGLTARTVAVWCDGRFEDNVSYALKDTPCGDVVGKTVCCFPSSVCNFFPRDKMLQDLRAESYAGVTLWDHTGQPIGLIAVIGRNPLKNRPLVEAILKTVAVRAGSEMERLEAEEALHQEQMFSKSVINSLPGIFYLYTYPEGRLVLWNKQHETLFGYKAEEMQGRHTLDWHRPESREAVLNAIETVMKTGHGSMEDELLTKDGNSIPFFLTGVKFESHGQSYLMGVGTDITERKRAEEEQKKLQEQLSQAQKMESIGRLAGGVAHNFNNMLGIILSCVELTMEEIDSKNPIIANIERIHRAAKRSADLTRQLMAFASRQMVLPRVIDLNETVNEMLRMLQQITGDDINIDWKPGAALKPVKMDPGQLDQVLVNLMINARDAISGTGKVTIETNNSVFDEACCASHTGFIPGEYVMLSVSDNGCGMDREMLANIFEPFFTTKELHIGSGLGLASIYGIVRQNNGFIKVYSKPGTGTTFKIYLPPYTDNTSRASCKDREETDVK